MGPGDTVAIFGAGPVGLMAAHSTSLRGASQIFVVDKEPDRLQLAEPFGATAVNFAEADPTEVIIDCTDGFGVGGVSLRQHEQPPRVGLRRGVWHRY